MNLPIKNPLTTMLSFQSDSEEEGEITTSLEPKDFRPDKQLTQSQLLKFLEYYSSPSSQDFKYNKTQLNKINSIIHNHFHYLSKDMKLFRLYKSFVTLATQEMHDWIEKDFHCGDVVLEILKEVQARKEHSWYLKLYSKLRLEDIIQKLVRKSEGIRKKAEDERIQQKRNRNWEKKQKKNLKQVDPFDYVPLPSKRRDTFNGCEKKKDDDKNENFYCDDLVNSLPCLDFLDSVTQDEALCETGQGKSQGGLIYEVDEWFVSLDDDLLGDKSENFPEIRNVTVTLDPRIEFHLKCRGFDFIMSNPMISCKLEKFQIILNLKCLVHIIEISKVFSLKMQIPKESSRILFEDTEYLVCFRPGWQDLLEVCKKCSDLLIFSLYPEEMSQKIIPNQNYTSSKCLNRNKELLLIFDNEKIGWSQDFLVPLLFFDPFLNEEKLLLNKKICNVRERDFITFCYLEGERQLEGLSRFLVNVYSNCIENSFKFTAIAEFKKLLRTIFSGLCFSTEFYERVVGSAGYTHQKLEAYCLLVEEMGGKIDRTGKYVIAENKSAENEVSGKWIVLCYLNFKYMEQI
jgi:hypothetical protein